MKNRYVENKVYFDTVSSLSKTADVKQYISKLYSIVFSYKKIADGRNTTTKNAQEKQLQTMLIIVMVVTKVKMV